MIRRRADANTYMSQLNKITGTNNWILQYLEDRDGEDVYQKDIEEKFSVTRSTVSKVLKGMEAKGLLFRENVSNDARLKRLKMTDEGRRISHLASIERDALESRMTEGLTEDELDTLEVLLKKIACNLAEK
jgi:DNA-binding MarR family transcriptional regulator